MKINKSKKFSAYIIIIFLVFMMLYSIISFILPKIVSKYNISSSNISKLLNVEIDSSENIDWEELYPFTSNEKQNISISKLSVLDKYKNKVKSLANKLENYTSENLIKYQKIVEFSYLYDKICNYSLVSNSSDTARIKINDKYLTRVVHEYDTTESANRLIEFNDYLKKLGIDFIYVQAPYKISNSTDSISNIYNDFSNQNMNNLLNDIDGKVDYIDIRKKIQENNIEHIKLFFKTDHHWTPKAGLWSTNQISKYLNDNYDLNLDINSNIENFTVKTYEKMFLGADGRYVTLANTEPEDFDLIVPNFNTQLSVKILDENIDKRGDYLETLIDKNKILYGDNYNIDQYSAYSYGTKPLIEIHNELVYNGKKILLIRDSFGNVVIPFLALETEYLSAIDLRSFTGSLKTYIENYKPDIVIVMYTGNHYAEYKENTNSLWEFE